MKTVYFFALLNLIAGPLRSEVTFSVRTDKAICRVGDTVHVVIVARNNGPAPDTLFFATSQQANYFIDAFDYSQQFAWLQSPTIRAIPPRDSITFDFANPARSIPPVEVGVHAVIGQVPGHWTSDTLWITVTQTTAIPDLGAPLREFVLAYNFPNPFNPTTTIRYAIPQRTRVTLTVFNNLGQQIATLVNEIQEAGDHEAKFDGTGLASGVYFYRLRAGEYVSSKKFVLLR